MRKNVAVEIFRRVILNGPCKPLRLVDRDIEVEIGLGAGPTASGSWARRRRCAASGETQCCRNRPDGPAMYRRPGRCHGVRPCHGLGRMSRRSPQEQGTGRDRQGTGLVQRPLAGERCLNTRHDRMALGTLCRVTLGLNVVGMVPGIMAAEDVGVERRPLRMPRVPCPARQRHGMRCGCPRAACPLRGTCESCHLLGRGRRRRTLKTIRSASSSASIPLKSCGVLGSAITNVQRTPSGSSSWSRRPAGLSRSCTRPRRSRRRLEADRRAESETRAGPSNRSR